MKYTAEEVRKSADWLYQWERKAGARNARAMLTAYAERIESDEAKALGTCPKHGVEYVGECSGCAMTLPEKDFTHPPAQAAQVDPAAKPHTLADFVHAPDAERAQIGQQVAARVDEMMAEPVARGESGVIRHVGDSRFESWFSEYVVGQNGAKQQARDAYGAGLAEQADRLAAQPRAVPDGAVEVLRKSLASDGHAVSIVFDSQESADRFHTQMDEAMKVKQNTAEPVAQHPDDAAVDAFAMAMKAKLAEARAKGRGGWQDKADCPQQQLSDMLRAHVAKGDPRDVANFCMFLHQRDESILPAEPVAQDDWRIGFFEGFARAAREKGYAGIAEAITAAPTAPSPGES